MFRVYLLGIALMYGLKFQNSRATLDRRAKGGRETVFRLAASFSIINQVVL